jgi:POT family proton-dependent oligopeptide transporter
LTPLRTLGADFTIVRNPESSEQRSLNDSATSTVGARSDLSQVPTSHPPAFWFFFWGEFAERASYYGMRTLLPLYLTTVLRFDDADASSLYYAFKMSAYFLPLLGGIIADRWLGKYWTIVGFSVPYVLGHFILGIPERWACLVALVLLACGTGVIKPNISALLGQTYDDKRPGREALRTSAFMWFYFSVNIGALISMFALPFIRDHSGYAMAFQFPAWLMVLALAIFAAGKPFYSKETRVVRVITPEERIEQRRTLIRLAGIFLLIAFFWFAYEHNDSIWVYFARDSMYHGFRMPDWLPAWLGGGKQWTQQADSYQYVNSLFVLLSIPAFNIFFRLIDPEKRVFTSVRRVLIGFALTALASGVMALAAWFTDKGTQKVSAYWLIAAYIVLTLGEVLLYGTMLDLSYAAAPKSMKGFVTGCFLLTNTLGNLLNVFYGRLYQNSLKPLPFFLLTMVIVLAATLAFYFVGRRFEKNQSPA